MITISTQKFHIRVIEDRLFLCNADGIPVGVQGEVLLRTVGNDIPSVTVEFKIDGDLVSMDGFASS